MKVVLAFDKFKGSATALQLIKAAQQSLCGLYNTSVECVPVADGGDGTTEVLATAMEGQWVTCPTMGPLLQMAPVSARYYLCDDGTAYIETASASGLALLQHDDRDVMRATTLGTGLLMRDAMERGSRHLVLGLGGSATCDAAMGILCALGAEFVDANGRFLYPSGESMALIDRIEALGIPQAVRDCKITLLTDVDCPLCGDRGAARVFAPQKGASPEQTEQLEAGLQHVAAIVGEEIATTPGCGAAGGIPSLMMHLLDCELLPGAPYVLAHNGMEQALDGADLVITGEGRLDQQTLMGKGPGCVIGMARERGIPVAAVCGTISPGFDAVRAGLMSAQAVSEGMPLDLAMDTASTLERVAVAVNRIVTSVIKSSSM